MYICTHISNDTNGIHAISIKGRERELKIDVIKLESSHNSSCFVYLLDGNKEIVFRNLIEI